MLEYHKEINFAYNVVIRTLVFGPSYSEQIRKWSGVEFHNYASTLLPI